MQWFNSLPNAGFPAVPADDAAGPTNHNLPTTLADRATIRRNRT
jgi:hypothetical protein